MAAAQASTEPVHMGNANRNGESHDSFHSRNPSASSFDANLPTSTSSSSSSPPYHQSSSFYPDNLHFSPRQMLAAQQHFGSPSVFAAQQQQQSNKQQQDDGSSSFDAAMWPHEDYDAFLRNLLEGQAAPIISGPRTLHDGDLSDLDPGSISSFSNSHASSYFSGNSDNGASPNSLPDFVYSSQGIGTSPSSDYTNPGLMAARHASMPINQGISPASMSGSVDEASLSNGFHLSPQSALTSLPSTHFGAMMQAGPPSTTSSTYEASPPSHGLFPPSSVVPATIQDAAAASQFPVTNAAWDPKFLAPSSAMMLPQTDISATSPTSAQSFGVPHPSLAAQAHQAPQSKKRSAAQLNASSAKTARKPSNKTAAANADGPDSKKIKSTPIATESSNLSQPVSRLPHMEVGSNATALAAVERLKAKRVQEAKEAQEAAAAKLKALSAQAASSDSTSTIKSESGDKDKVELTPAMRQQKKVAHNAIERRYRNNINDRIAALRKAVPALRELRPRKTPSGRKSRKAQQEEDLVDGVPAATKLNKATILGKATEYIKYLKSRELRLAAEVTGLRELVRSLEGGEELLELWEGEMEKVVAEQEAAAAAAAAAQEEEDSLNMDMDDGEDDDQDDADEEDDANAGNSSRSSAASSPSMSRRQSRAGGRGPKLGSVASSRYMLATFLGVTFLGGGAEIALDASASDATHAVSRPSSARMVLDTSHQLLKRSTSYMAPSAPIVQETHHLDHVPAHVLALEVIRTVSFVICFLFLIWPLLARLIPGSSDALREERRARKEAEALAERRGEMLSALSKPDLAPSAIDNALRSFVNAPQTRIGAATGIARELGILAFRHFWGGNRRPMPETDAVWVRLLEVETTQAHAAQPSQLLRLHTALKVTNIPPPPARAILAGDAILSPARVHGTLAIAYARLGDGYDFAQDAADREWELARASAPGGWVDAVLELDLDEALELLGPASLSPLTAVADGQYMRTLADVWSTLFTALVRGSVNDVDPSTGKTIAALAATAPAGTRAHALAQTTLATWSLLHSRPSPPVVKSGSAASHALLAPAATTPPPHPLDRTDALAAATITWIRLRHAKQPIRADAALHLRRLVHLSRAPHLEDAQDELVDMLSSLGRKAVRGDSDDSGVEW